MNSVKKSYKYWSEIYDTNDNKTRDLDLKVSQEILSKINFESILEVGCGTGKNTLWLSKIAKKIIAVDFSPEMLEIAMDKVKQGHVEFKEADITKPWGFNKNPVDLITINLVLEHIKDLDWVFKNANQHLNKNGYLFISELHPFKQFLGSQAKFNNELVNSYTHQISDYLNYAKKYNFKYIELVESFDNSKNKNEERIPRLISFLFKK